MLIKPITKADVLGNMLMHPPTTRAFHTHRRSYTYLGFWSNAEWWLTTLPNQYSGPRGIKERHFIEKRLPRPPTILAFAEIIDGVCEPRVPDTSGKYEQAMEHCRLLGLL